MYKLRRSWHFVELPLPYKELKKMYVLMLSGMISSIPESVSFKTVI